MRVLIYNASKPFYNLATEKLKVIHKKDEIFENIDLFLPNLDIAYLSVIFSWDVKKLCEEFFRVKAEKILLGGSGISLLSDYIKERTGLQTHIGLWDEIDEIKVMDPFLVFTSRGCIRKCPFCLVPQIENFKEYKNFQIASKIQDNNFLACSRTHRDKVYRSLKSLKHIDFNQGLDARLFNEFDLKKMLDLDMELFRFAFDSLDQENALKKAISLLNKYGVKDWRKIAVYVLYGFQETPKEAFYRIKKVIDLGARPFVMPYKPLDWLEKDKYYVNQEKGWTSRLMMHTARFYNKVWLFTGGKGKIEQYMKNHHVEEFFLK